jgi:hypothetical protein
MDWEGQGSWVIVMFVCVSVEGPSSVIVVGWVSLVGWLSLVGSLVGFHE